MFEDNAVETPVATPGGQTAQADTDTGIPTVSIDDTMKAIYKKNLEQSEQESPTSGTPEKKNTPEESAKTQEKPAEPAKDGANKAGESTKTQESIDPPASWTKEAKEKFKTLPPDLQAELRKREDDVTRGIQQLSSYKKVVEQVNQIIQPYQARLQSAGITVPMLLERFLKWDYTLASGTPSQKAQAKAELLQAYGLGSDEEVTQAYVDPDVKALQEKLSLIERQQQAKDQHFQTQTQQALMTQAANAIKDFEADKSNKYFSEVREEMAYIMGAGLAVDMKDAYEKAIWAKPSVREKLIAEKQTEKLNAEKEKADKAKAASATNIKSNAVNGGVDTQNSSMDDTMRAVYRAAQSRP